MEEPAGAHLKEDEGAPTSRRARLAPSPGGKGAARKRPAAAVGHTSFTPPASSGSGVGMGWMEAAKLGFGRGRPRVALGESDTGSFFSSNRPNKKKLFNSDENRYN